MQINKDLIMEIVDKCIDFSNDVALGDQYDDTETIEENRRALDHYRKQIERVLDGQDVIPYVNLLEWAIAIGHNTSLSLEIEPYTYIYEMKHDPAMSIVGYVCEIQGTHRRVGFLHGSYKDGYDYTADPDNLPDWAYNRIQKILKSNKHKLTVYTDSENAKHTFIIKEK